MMISVCILTKNAEVTLKRTLDSVRSFPEVILLDSGSTDRTLEIAKNYPNVHIHTSPFIGFGSLRNRAAGLAKYPWILALDSDEVLSNELIEEINKLNLNENVAYNLPRHNYLKGKRVRGCGWDGEYTARLYHRKFTAFSDRQVHEALTAKALTNLKAPLIHTPYRATADFLSKMQHYSTLFAEQNRGKKKANFWIALAHASFAFFRSFFFQRGVFCGTKGWIISFYIASTTFYKYLKLAELNRESRSSE